MPLTEDVDGGLVQADTRTTMPQPPRRDVVDWSAQRMRPPSRELFCWPPVCRVLSLVGWVGCGGYVVAILCVCYYWCGCSRTILGCGKCRSWEGDIEVASVSHVCWGREVFGKDITGVSICSYSPNL